MASPPAEPFDVFLSYHSADAEWVGALKAALEAKGIRVWLDSEQIRPGDLFPNALSRAISSVRSVVLVLSPGSVASAWVQEEFTLALAQRRHVIGALLDDVEPPGFLQGRTWVDFRDAAAFAAGVDQLVFGITGTRPATATPSSAPAFRETAPSGDSAEETEVLKRLIARRRQDVRRLWQARVASGATGAAIGGVFAFVAGDAAVSVRAGVALVAPLIMVLAAWGLTATSLTKLDHKVEQFEVLHDGLEACRSRSHPGCKKLRQHFWDLITNIAVDPATRAA